MQTNNLQELNKWIPYINYGQYQQLALTQTQHFLHANPQYRPVVEKM